MPALNGSSSYGARTYPIGGDAFAVNHGRSPSLIEGGPRLSEELSGVSNTRSDGTWPPPPAVPSSLAAGAGTASGVFPASSMSAARTVTAPNASSEEIEMSMKAFARDLIGDLGGVRALNANRQLTSLLDGTEPNSATQKYLRKFMYALHMMNVPSMYDSKDAAHLSTRNAMVNAFIDAIDAAAKHHLEQPGKSDEVFGAKLDFNSQTGKASYKAWSKAWAALNDALSQRSTGASDMEHLQAYYALHVMPRTQLRAQFVYGETTDDAEARLCSGSKQAVWDASRQLLCCNAANAEEKGMNLASASELLHMMPEFLRRPKNNPDATNPPRNQAPDNPRSDTHRDRAGEVPSDRSGSTGERASAAGSPQSASAANGYETSAPAPAPDAAGPEANPVYTAEAGPRGRELWNANVNGDQIMTGHEINLYLGSDANRNTGAANSGHRPGRERFEPDGAPESDAAAGSAGGGNAGDDDAQLVAVERRSRRPSTSEASITAEAGTPGEPGMTAAGLNEHAGAAATTSPPATATRTVPPATPEATRRDTERVNQHAGLYLTEGNGFERRPRSNSEESSSSSHSLARTFSPSDPSRVAVGGTPPTSRSVSPASPHYEVPTSPTVVLTTGFGQRLLSETARARQSGDPVRTLSPSYPGQNMTGGASPSSRSASPGSPRFDVPLSPPVVLTTGFGQRNPSEAAKTRQSMSPTPNEVE